MSIITLTTDFGLKDYSVGAVKGAIYGKFPDAKIVDISHLISPFNIVETAYVLKNAYKSFPKGTIHIVGVDSEYNPIKKHLVFALDGHYFICADNGIISMITSEINPTEIVEITIVDLKETPFPTLDIFVEVACHIARGGKLSVIGKKKKGYKKLVEINPDITDNKIKAKVIYVDNYNNIITNLHKSIFERVAKEREFNIYFNRYSFKKIHTQYNGIVNYSEEKTTNFDGKRLALFNSSGLLEIAIFKGNSSVGGASSLLGISYGSTITIDFFTENTQ